MDIKPEKSSKIRAASPGASNDWWAILPVKVLAQSKRRLQECLGDQRARFTLAMLEDVLQALGDSTRVTNVAVVTADAQVATLAHAHGFTVIDEPASNGMNPAIHLGVATARNLGAHRVLVLPADVPLATGNEIDRLLGLMDEGETNDGRASIGILPSADGHGTNLLCMGAGQVMETRYGENSFIRHREQALALGYHPLTLSSPLLGIDIDVQQDIDDLMTYCALYPAFRDTHSWKFLERTGLGNVAPAPRFGSSVE